MSSIFSDRLASELHALKPGTWVAIHNDQIIATGITPKEVYDASQEAGVEVPLLWCIPDPNISYYYAVQP